MNRPTRAGLDSALNERRARHYADRLLELENSAAIEKARLLLSRRHEQEIIDLATKLVKSPEFDEIFRAFRSRADLKDAAETLIAKLETL